MREVVALADRANQYIDEKKPWLLARQEGGGAAVHAVCSVGVRLMALALLTQISMPPNLSIVLLTASTTCSSSRSTRGTSRTTA